MDHPLTAGGGGAGRARRDPGALVGWGGDWAGLRVAVLGLDAEGFAAADTLVELGADALVVAAAPDEDRERVLDVLGVTVLREADASARAAAVDRFGPDLVVASSRWDPAEASLAAARAAGLPVWGEVELAWRIRDKASGEAPWILVTGGRGAPIVAELTTRMLEAGELRAAPCGSGGVPVLDAVRDPEGFAAFVVELDAPALALLGGAVEPHASVCVDAGGERDPAALAVLGTVYRNTSVACVYNRGDARTEKMVQEADVIEGARAIGFGLDAPGMSDLGIVDGILCDRAFLAERRDTALELCTLDELRGVGLADRGSVTAILAAAALARSLGVTPGTIHSLVLALGG